MKQKVHTGFTLIELIIVIVLLGIMSVGAGMLISRPIEAYGDQLRRQQLVDSAEMAVRKIEADIRRALPNSIRVIELSPNNSWVLEMVNTVDGARYRDEAGGIFTTANEILSFTSAAGDQQFNLLGLFTSLPSIGLPINYATYQVVIYNTNHIDIYADAAASSNPGIISPAGLTLNIDGTGVEHNLTLSSAFQFRYQSPTQRLFIVDGPVSYICDNATGLLVRYDAYAYQASQNDVDTDAELSALGANVDRVATQLSGCDIDYQAGSPQRGGLITLDMNLTDIEGESVRLLHQVHVDNLP